MKISEGQVQLAASSLGLDQALLDCWVAIESAWECSAPRYEPAWGYLVNAAAYARKLGISEATEIQLQMFSWGPLQIMGSVARELGFDGHLPELIYPNVGLFWGGTKIMKVLKSYGMTTDAIAAYNAGSPRKDDQGRYDNQAYVDKFLAEWQSRGYRVDGITLLP